MIRKVVSTKYVDGETGLDYHFEPVSKVKIKKTKDGYEARYLASDDMPQSPQEDGDNNIFLVNYHRDFDVRNDEVITEDDIRAFYQGEKIRHTESFWLFPLACLIHSGVWLSLNPSFACDSQGWDTSHVGAVLVSRKEARDQKQAEKLAEGLVKTWNQYLTNDIYCVVKETYDGDKKPVSFDIVGGYYGEKRALEGLGSL